MLIIILSWIYITALAYVTGVSAHAVIGKLTGSSAAEPLHFSIKCLTGLLVITFISTVSCLVMPLGPLFSCLLLLIAVGGGFFFRDQLRASWRSDREKVRQTRWIMRLFFVLLVFIMAYLAYMPSSHHDDGLYYSTSIKWLQEYGTVKGLSNINSRIGFNSIWLILQASFGFQYLKIGLFNDMNGLLFLLVFLYSMGGMQDLLRGNRSFVNGVRALFMLPLLAFHFGAASDMMLFNVNFISSPSPDLPTCLLICMIFLIFLGEEGRSPEGEGGALEREGRLSGEERGSPGSGTLTDVLVVFYSIWVCCIKLSSVPILLLSCFILIRLIRRRLFRQVIFMILCGGLFATPWLIRNVFISGYLLFPVASIDLFHVPWKLPMPDTKWHQDEVRSFILGADLSRPFDIPFTKWFPAWLARLDFIRQVIAGTVFLAMLTYVLTGLWQLRKGLGFFIRHQRKTILIITGTAGVVFWLFQAPDFRFGYGFLLFYCIFFLTALFYYFLEGYYRLIVFPAILYLAALEIVYYKPVWTSLKPYFAAPLPYRMPAELHKLQLGTGQDINLVSHDDSWNAPLPAANNNEYNVLLPVYMGQGINDGFRSTEKEDH